MKKEKKLTKKTCPVCGKEFYTTDKRHIYCCMKCRNKASHLRERKRIKEGTPKRERPTKEKKQVNENLIEVAIKARQAGMTYGKYVAMCYAKGIKV